MRFVGLSLSILLAAGIAAAQVKRPEPPVIPDPFTKSLQAVVVSTADANATTGTARLFERKNAKSDWKATGDSFPIVVGRSGLAWGIQLPSEPTATKVKQEGDGNAPAGLFPLTSAFGGAAKPIGVELPYVKLDQYTECVDDVNSTFYNRIVNRLHVGNFDWKSSEKMLAVGPEYDLGVFVAYNTYPVEKGRGSCIFLHVWKDANTATSGCTAMERRHMERVVAWLVPSKNPYLVQMTEADHDRYRKTWKLPKIK